MSELFKKAKRKETWLKIGMSGSSGSGKTYSSLLFAKGFMGSLDDVGVLDTENGSASLYEHLGGFKTLSLPPPFHPQRYAKAIDVAHSEGIKFLIIDSASHEWDGEGGVLDIHSKMQGNSFTNWAKINPMHKEFVDAILQSHMHIICTIRRKQDYEIVEVNGKKVPQKMGLKEIQRDGFEYDLSLNFDIDINHHATVSKDRTGIFKSDIPFKITEQVGMLVAEWNKGSNVTFHDLKGGKDESKQSTVNRSPGQGCRGKGSL